MVTTATSAVVFVRMDPNLRQDAEEILNELGISPSTAVQLLYKQIIIQQGLPFSITFNTSTPLNIGKMDAEQLNIVLAEGLNSLNKEKYTQNDVNEQLSSIIKTENMTPNLNILYSKASVEDLKDIYAHIAFTLRAHQTAKDVLQRIFNEIIKLGVFPNTQATEVTTKNNKSIRKLIVKNYVVDCSNGIAQLSLDKYAILYQADNNDSVAILRVCYEGRENVENLA